VAFLHHMVSKEGVSVDPQKIETITKWPALKNATKVWSFLGLVGTIAYLFQMSQREQCLSPNWLGKWWNMSGQEHASKHSKNF